MGEIGRGLLILLGVATGDGEAEARWCAEKVAGLRVFPDQDDKMNLSLLDMGGEALVVSQFTLLGNVGKGKRPSFVGAAEPNRATELYERFVALLRQCGVRVATGVFAAKMSVSLVNEGPVTIIVDRNSASSNSVS